MKGIPDKEIFFNSHSKLGSSSNNPYFHCRLPKNITDKFTMVRDLCRFLQLDFIFSIRFEEKLVILILTMKQYI